MTGRTLAELDVPGAAAPATGAASAATTATDATTTSTAATDATTAATAAAAATATATTATAMLQRSGGSERTCGIRGIGADAGDSAGGGADGSVASGPAGDAVGHASGPDGDAVGHAGGRPAYWGQSRKQRNKASAAARRRGRSPGGADGEAVADPPLVEYPAGSIGDGEFDFRPFFLHRARTELYDRIGARCEEMVFSGGRATRGGCSRAVRGGGVGTKATKAVQQLRSVRRPCDLGPS
eukprot:219459-Chlamydomonas_euryale.AAC.1